MMKFAAAFIFFISLNASAAELYEYNNTVRQKGMGGVYVFREDDAFSFLKNPAYTCYTSGINWTMFGFGLGSNGYSLLESLEDFEGIDGLESLDPFYGKRVYLELNANTTMTLPCFGVSYWYDVWLALSATNPTFPRLDVGYQKDEAFQIGGGVWLSEKLVLGLSLKRVTRLGGDQTFGADILNNITDDQILDSFQNTGRAWGLDMGLVYREKSKLFNPTVSLSWKDVGRTTFRKTAGAQAPAGQRENLTLAMTFEGSVPGFGVAGGLEYRHILNNDEQLGQKLHLGTEISIPLVDVRAGFSQGYTTYGLGIDLFLFQLDLAQYSVERGEYPGQTEDERLAFSLTMELGFDADFNLVDIGGGKRKLKRRR